MSDPRCIYAHCKQGGACLYPRPDGSCSVIEPAPMRSGFTDDELLGLLDEERGKFTRSNEELMRRYVDELVARCVYPTHWPGPDVWKRVQGWGAYWHRWSEPLHCPHCNADLRDRSWGPPGKREIGRSDLYLDRIVEYQCPDCGKRWPP